MTTENFKTVTKALVDAADGYERDVVKRLIDAWLEEENEYRCLEISQETRQIALGKMMFIENILGID